jgi:small subunit ribosomal protein S4e
MGTDSIRHQKRLAAPLSYPIARKPFKYTFHGEAGAHGIKDTNAIPLGLILRETLGFATSSKELKYILNRRQVFVDGKPKISPRWMVGPNDVLSIPSIDEYYRLTPWVGRRKIKLVPIDKKDSNWKLCVIKNKKTLRGGDIQLNLSDGRNIRITKDDKDFSKYVTKGTLKIELPSQKILDFYPFELNSPVLITRGTNTGLSGKLSYVEKRIGKNRSIAIVESSSSDEKIITAMENVVIIGKNEAVIPVFEPSEEETKE